MNTARHEMPLPKAAIRTITFGTKPCPLGLVLVAATPQGICAILLGSDENALLSQLRSIFPQPTLRRDAEEVCEALASIVRVIEDPTIAFCLPLDVQGTPFQERVWRALREIPVGETATYKEIAVTVGATAQEVGEACAANVLAVVIPCHRVVRRNGGLAGYRWGVSRKRLLLQREQEMAPDPESLFAPSRPDLATTSDKSPSSDHWKAM